MVVTRIAIAIFIAMYLSNVQEIYPFVKDSIMRICVREGV